MNNLAINNDKKIFIQQMEISAMENSQKERNSVVHQDYLEDYLPQRKTSEQQPAQPYQQRPTQQYQQQPPTQYPPQTQYQPQYQAPPQQQYQAQYQQHYQPQKQQHQDHQQQYYQQPQRNQYPSERQEDQRLPPRNQPMDDTYTLPKNRMSDDYSIEEHQKVRTEPKQTFVNESSIVDEDEDADEESSAKETPPMRVEFKSTRSASIPSQPPIPVKRQPTDEDASIASDDRFSPERTTEDVYPISPRASAPRKEKVTLQGFFKMLEELNFVLPQSHPRQMFYKPGIHVEENERRELLSNADKGAFRLLDDRITPEKLSSIILDQLPSIVQNLEGGYLWSDKLVKNPPVEKTCESIRYAIKKRIFFLFNLKID